MIYADNAATTRISDAALNTFITLSRDTYGNASSLYTVGQRAKEALEQARADIASVIHAEPREILFTSGGSEADNQAIRSAAALGLSKGKKHITGLSFQPWHYRYVGTKTAKKMHKKDKNITFEEYFGIYVEE